MRAQPVGRTYSKWWTLGALSFSLFMIMLDNTVVNVALSQRLSWWVNIAGSTRPRSLRRESLDP
jgi:hypothetical protein